MYGLSSFFIGEQRVAAELGPIMRAAPREDMRVFLCTQIADEARHVAFFDRFYREVGVLEADGLQERLAETSEHLNPEFGTLFDELLRRRVDRLAAEPDDTRGARRGDHDLPHGHRGDARPHRPALHHRLQRAPRDAARASSRASRTSRATSTATSPSARASCATWRARTRATARRSSARWPRSAPAAEGVLRPRWVPEGAGGRAVLRRVGDETRAFAQQALERRLKVIGLLGRRLTPAAAYTGARVRRAPRVRPDAARARGAAAARARRARAGASLARVLAVVASWSPWLAALRDARAARLVVREPIAFNLLTRRRCSASRRAAARSCACRRAPGRGAAALRRRGRCAWRPTAATSARRS